MKFYFECEDIAVDENGNPCLAGCEIELPSYVESDDAIYFLSSVLKIDEYKIQLISKEEYDEKYGDDEDE